MNYDFFTQNFGNLPLLTDYKSRSVTAENPTGEKGEGAKSTDGVAAGCAEHLGRGWKVSPFFVIKPGVEFDLAGINGPGKITHIWMGGGISRDYIIRFYWEGMEEYVILDNVRGCGQYVGTAYFVGLNGAGNWWGEGEVKFYIDGDTEFPTICGTGTEDYFGGSYDWEVDGKYTMYSTPFMGMYQVMEPENMYDCLKFEISGGNKTGAYQSAYRII